MRKILFFALFALVAVLFVATSSRAYDQVAQQTFEIKKAETLKFWENPWYYQWFVNVVSYELMDYSISPDKFLTAKTAAAQAIKEATFIDNGGKLINFQDQSVISYAAFYNFGTGKISYDYQDFIWYATLPFDKINTIYGDYNVKTLLHESIHAACHSLDLGTVVDYAYDIDHCITWAMYLGKSTGDPLKCFHTIDSINSESGILLESSGGMEAFFTTISDVDKDGILNYEDPDVDGDGLLNVAEMANGTDPFFYDTDLDAVSDSEDHFPLDYIESKDTDGDGLGDVEDISPLNPDSDGDGVSDLFDGMPQDPNDTTDSDNDGLGDNAEISLGSDPFNKDSDKDGVLDGVDAGPTDKTLGADTDKDGIEDLYDLDIDGDGLDNDVEKNGKPKTDPLKNDTDEDGVIDSLDPFPLNAKEFKDSDGDGFGDTFELKIGTNPYEADSDGDGAIDSDDKYPTDSSKQFDTDSDGIPNSTDPDIDEDGHLNADDKFPYDSNEWEDTDNDGLGNKYETKIGTSNNNSDSDGDLLQDGFEIESAISPKGKPIMIHRSDPLKKDTDGNGLFDDAEVELWKGGCDITLPQGADRWADSDGDGFADCYDWDRDGDGLVNEEEITAIAEAKSNPDKKDTDYDSVNDMTDNCKNVFNPDQANITLQFCMEQKNGKEGWSMWKLPGDQAQFCAKASWLCINGQIDIKTWCDVKNPLGDACDIDDDDDSFTSPPTGPDCNDQDPNIGPLANEICGNKIDDNCNSFIDETCTSDSPIEQTSPSDGICPSAQAQAEADFYTQGFKCQFVPQVDNGCLNSESPTCIKQWKDCDFVKYATMNGKCPAAWIAAPDPHVSFYGNQCWPNNCNLYWPTNNEHYEQLSCFCLIKKEHWCLHPLIAAPTKKSVCGTEESSWICDKMMQTAQSQYDAYIKKINKLCSAGEEGGPL